MLEQMQTKGDVRPDLWDELLDEKTGPAAIVIREHLRPAAGPRTPVAPPTFAPARGQGKSDYHWDGENPENWPTILQAVKEGQIVNRCTLDSIPSQANRMESYLKRFEGVSIPRVRLSGVKGDSMSLLDVGHRVADAACWAAGNYDDFRKALDAFVQGDAGELAKLAPTSVVFGYWDSRGTTGSKARRLIRSEIFAENIVKLTRKSQYWASVNPEASEDLKKALDEAKAKAKDDQEKDVGSQLGFRDAPASGLGGVICHGGITRLTILSLTGLRNLSMGSEEKGDPGVGLQEAVARQTKPTTLQLRRYLLALMLAAAPSSRTGWDLREGCLLVQERKPKDAENDCVPDIVWRKVFHDGREPLWKDPPCASDIEDYLHTTAEEFFKPKLPDERTLIFNPATAAQRVREKLAEKDKSTSTASLRRRRKKA